MREPNNLLRAARLRRSSPSGSVRPMSRQEMADALNSVLFLQSGKRYALDANYVGKLERGKIRWPHATYRQALRLVLDAATDAELGLHRLRGMRQAEGAPERNADLGRPQPSRRRRAMRPVQAAVTVRANQEVSGPQNHARRAIGRPSTLSDEIVTAERRAS